MIEKMVPDTGALSNSAGGALIAAWETKDKQKNDTHDLFSDPLKLDELFSTLADWNDYLENHVPYFANEVDGGPK